MAADICITSVSPTACGHFNVVVLVDGILYTYVFHTTVVTPLSAEEVEEYVRLCIRRNGIPLDQLEGRVIRGDEATNVKQYDIIGAGSAITKTNIGTVYVDVLPGANGQRALIDFTGCLEYRIILTANLVGTGPFGVRLVRDSDNAVLYENASIALTGERELDTNWQPLPAAASGLQLARLQAKSIVAADDPVFRRCIILVR
jgi:hypothetical protein